MKTRNREYNALTSNKVESRCFGCFIVYYLGNETIIQNYITTEIIARFPF